MGCKSIARSCPHVTRTEIMENSCKTYNSITHSMWWLFAQFICQGCYIPYCLQGFLYSQYHHNKIQYLCVYTHNLSSDNSIYVHELLHIYIYIYKATQYAYWKYKNREREYNVEEFYEGEWRTKLFMSCVYLYVSHKMPKLNVLDFAPSSHCVAGFPCVGINVGWLFEDIRHTSGKVVGINDEKRKKKKKK